MNNEWWRQLKGRPFYWVLDGSDLAASYYMLKQVVERPDSARGLKAARLELMESPQVAVVKARLVTEGEAIWDSAYKSPLWALRLLAEWGYPGDDETIAECLDWALDHHNAESSPVSVPLLLHCATAFGFYEDERVQALTATIEASLSSATDGRWLVLIAMGLAQIPAEQQNHALIQNLAAQLAQLTPNSDFAPYTYPTYNTPSDLTLAEAALQLGIEGEWLAPWIERIVAAQDEQGLWRVNHVHPLPNGVPGATPNTANRWVSAKALYVLRTYFGE